MRFDNEATQIAEQSVIGAIILDEKVLSAVVDIIIAEDFYFSNLADCYKAILELSSRGKPIDFVTVLNQVTASDKYNETEIKQLLISCTNLTPSISNAEHYAKIVANLHKARQIQEVGKQLALDDVNAENADETLNRAVSELFEIAKKSGQKKLKSIGDVGGTVFEEYINGGKDLENRSETGFTKLDETLKGMTAGNLIILAARPKVGKTAFALSIAENVAKSGKTVAFFSLEMQAKEIYERLLSKRAGIPMNTLIDKRFNDKKRPQKIRTEEITKIAENIDEIYSLPIMINDNPGCNVNDVRLESRMIKNLGLIVIDYLQLMSSPKRYDNRNLEIGAISRELKILASDLGVPILCLSQLNRTNDEYKRPSPCDLRDSGSIEQDCSKLIMMWCVEKNLNEAGQVESKTVGVDVALNRRGKSGVTLFNFNGNYMHFIELDRVYEENNNEKNIYWRKNK